MENVGELGYELYLTDGAEKSTYYGGAFRKKDLPDKTIKQVLDGETYHGIDSFDTGIFITGFFDNDVRNTIGVPVQADGKQLALFIRQDPEKQFGELRIFFAMILIFTSIISILLVLISGRYIVKPVVKLTNATKKIRKGNYDVAFEVRRKDEIGQLADCLRKWLVNSKNLKLPVKNLSPMFLMNYNLRSHPCKALRDFRFWNTNRKRTSRIFNRVIRGDNTSIFLNQTTTHTRFT